jgi:hemerythrin superfamily protein
MQLQIRETMLQEHQLILSLLQQLLDACDTNDQHCVQDAWQKLEPALRNHLEAEERCLFPLLEPAHPVEVAASRAEHAEIRRLLDELGLQAELHTSRKQRIEQLATRLEAHARREGDGLYRWAEHAASKHDRSMLKRILLISST